MDFPKTPWSLSFRAPLWTLPGPRPDLVFTTLSLWQRGSTSASGPAACGSTQRGIPVSTLAWAQSAWWVEARAPPSAMWFHNSKSDRMVAGDHRRDRPLSHRGPYLPMRKVGKHSRLDQVPKKVSGYRMNEIPLMPTVTFQLKELGELNPISEKKLSSLQT